MTSKPMTMSGSCRFTTASLEKKPATSARAIILALVTSLWLGACAAGMGWLWIRSLSPCPVGRAPETWPAESILQPVPGKATLVMMVHPHCPCSRASIGELARVIRHVSTRVRAYVLFVRPKCMPEGWEKTDLWDSAAAIPGVSVLSDLDGAEAQRFGSETSGSVMVYSDDGKLAFEGGITPGRGHAGSNAGSDAIIAYLTGTASASRTDYFAFGCALFDHESSSERVAEEQDP